jgi:uncharacterized protein
MERPSGDRGFLPTRKRNVTDRPSGNKEKPPVHDDRVRGTALPSAGLFRGWDASLTSVRIRPTRRANSTQSTGVPAAAVAGTSRRGQGRCAGAAFAPAVIRKSSFTGAEVLPAAWRAYVVELDRLIEALSDPAAYPFSARHVGVRHTHISVVFLAGPYAYKVKKPVNPGFLDFTTLEKRRHFCEEEVRLNRRLAPDVYLGVAPVTADATGLRVEGRGPVVEWAVKMRRLPDAATLQARLQRGDVGPALMTDLARRIAAFHARAEGGKDVAACARFEAVARNARENFTQSAGCVGVTVSRAVFDRLRSLTEESLTRLRPLIEERADGGLPRDTHGDLRLDHVYYFSGRQPPGDLVILDCVEFDRRFRHADPVADMAFLFMDLAFHGRRDLAHVFADAYFQATGDRRGRELLPFYSAYRAAVRGKVKGLELAEREIPGPERAAALVKARAHWLVALGELEVPSRKPCLVLVGGLPGTGKSTLARGLAAQSGFRVVRSDQVRKELAAADHKREDLYAPEWTELTYAECLRRTEQLVCDGERVVVDATFGRERQRRTFLEAAARWGVPSYVLVCQADSDVVRERLRTRKDDLSDADWAVHVQAARRWEPPTGPTQEALRVIDTSGGAESALSRACEALATAHRRP